ncbi:MAG: SH3 domain-containing protein [Ignavibacteriaceae bacterium]|nr:SH3 domain-containing protein [Ignavibacteriaceae bacterium]
MKQSELDKIFKKLEKITFSDDLSMKIMKSFKPQLELVESFQKKIEDSYNNHKIFEANISQPFFDAMRDQIEAVNKTSLLFYEQNKVAMQNISKNFHYAQESIFGQSYKLANAFAKQLLPQLNYYEDLSKIIASSQGLVANNLSDIIHNNVSNVQELFRNIEISPIVEQLKYIRSSQHEMKFGHNVIMKIDDIKRENDFNLLVDDIEKLLSEQINKNDPSTIGSSFFQGLLFFLLSIIFTIYQGNIQEQNIINRISSAEDKIVHEIKRIIPKEKRSSKIIYIVRTKLNVRNEPSSKSLIIDCLYPNNKVEFIKADLEWFYVEYFDFIDGIPKYGWIYSKYLYSQEAN